MSAATLGVRYSGRVTIAVLLVLGAFARADTEVVGPIDRCAATCVDPETARRDLNVPLFLQRGFGHVDMGVYASVCGAGAVAKGDPVTPPG